METDEPMRGEACPTCGRPFDVILACLGCRKNFEMRPAEILFYEQHGLSEPKHCEPCRARRRAKRKAKEDAKLLAAGGGGGDAA